MSDSDSALALRTGSLAFVVVFSAVIGAGFLVAPAGAQSADATEIDSCTTISDSGRYVLTADVQDSDAGTCIEVRADDVVLDGNGHVIDGQNDTDSVAGVSATSQSNVVVTNLEVSDWQSGINFTEVTESEVSSVIARSNGNGIELAAGSENTLSDNTLANNSNGIFLHAVGESSADENTLANNTVLNNRIGVTFIGADNNTVTNNTVRDSFTYGLAMLFAKSGNDYNTFRDNVVTGSVEDGVCFLRARHNTFEDTYVSGSGRYDVYAVNGSVDNRMENLTLTSTTLSISFQDVSLDAVDDPPATPPAQGPVGYVNATDTSGEKVDAYLAVDAPDADGSSDSDEDAIVYEYSDEEWTPIGERDDESVNVTDLGEANTHHVLAFVGDSFVGSDASESTNTTTTESNGGNTTTTAGTGTTSTTTVNTATSTETSTTTTAGTTDTAASTTTTEENQGQATETSGPGFGLVAAVLAVLSIALLAARRR